MKQRGFTLIELMIAVAIFAVVSAIAIPLYTQYSERGYRTELTADLMNCAQALERFNAGNFTYVGSLSNDGDPEADEGSVAGPVGTDICNPTSVQQGRYAITGAVTVNTYLLTAVGAGPMADTGDITMDQAGNRTWDENDNGNIDAGEDDWEES